MSFLYFSCFFLILILVFKMLKATPVTHFVIICVFLELYFFWFSYLRVNLDKAQTDSVVGDADGQSKQAVQEVIEIAENKLASFGTTRNFGKEKVSLEVYFN
jgi:hypothetical protein